MKIGRPIIVVLAWLVALPSYAQQVGSIDSSYGFGVLVTSSDVTTCPYRFVQPVTVSVTGTITLSSLVDGTGCRVIVADDGVGLPEGSTWPRPGRLGAVIVQSLKQNAQAQMEVHSTPDEGMKVVIFFAQKAAEP